nr:MAG TPA: hypothetical protein [Caudoviricetes sp.]
MIVDEYVKDGKKFRVVELPDGWATVIECK